MKEIEIIRKFFSDNVINGARSIYYNLDIYHPLDSGRITPTYFYGVKAKRDKSLPYGELRINMNNYSEMGKKGAKSRWDKMSPAERSAEMSRRRRLGHDNASTRLKSLGEETNINDAPPPNV